MRRGSCWRRSTSSPRSCAGRSSTSTTSTWRSGSSGWGTSCGLRPRPNRPGRTTCSPDPTGRSFMTASAGSVGDIRDASGWAGHPRGLSTLFFTEMWERFSYYGMRAFLILYMVHALGFDDAHAGSVYGTYTGSVWFAAIFGGIIADRWLGHYRSVLVGGIIIALGHFTLALHALPFFYTGLSFIVIGTGLLKPNVSTLVGSLYEQGDERRDAGFSIFYMGINLGAFIGPIVAGYLAQQVDWHLGFACAGVGMTLGLVQYVAGREHLRPAVERLGRPPRPAVDWRHVLLAALPTLLLTPVLLWRWLMSFTVEE